MDKTKVDLVLGSLWCMGRKGMEMKGLDMPFLLLVLQYVWDIFLVKYFWESF